MTQLLRFAVPTPSVLCDNSEMSRCRQPDTAAGFFDADRHNEALTLLCADSLLMGEPDAAFKFADRRCRVVTPSTYDLLLRATASRLMNETHYAEADLVRAFDIDPTTALLRMRHCLPGQFAHKPGMKTFPARIHFDERVHSGKRGRHWNVPPVSNESSGKLDAA